jgi:hypothetical protein
LRSLRAMTDEALQQLEPRFNSLYAKPQSGIRAGSALR